MFFRLGCGLICLVLIAGCASRLPENTDPDATTRMLSGRIAASDGKESVSGTLLWEERLSGFRIDFRAGMGQGWVLEQTTNGADLYLSNGEQFQANYAEDLVQRAWGWSVPITELWQWLHPQQHRDQFTWQGWDVRYLVFADGKAGLLPSLIEVKKPPYRLRLAIKSRRENPRP